MSNQFKHIKEVLIEKGFAYEGMVEEKADCTVRALSITKGISYQAALKYAYDNLKRERNSGPSQLVLERGFEKDSSLVPVKEIKTYYINNGKKVERSMTVGTFIKEHNKGKFYVIVRAHALAVVDGVIIDHSEGLRRPILKAWRAIED